MTDALKLECMSILNLANKLQGFACGIANDSVPVQVDFIRGIAKGLIDSVDAIGKLDK